MRISRSSAQGIAVLFTVIAGMSAAFLALYLVMRPDSWCPTTTDAGALYDTIRATRVWWPIGVSCEQEIAGTMNVSEPNWNLTYLAGLGAVALVLSVPFWRAFKAAPRT